jgi:hypothetical protein
LSPIHGINSADSNSIQSNAQFSAGLRLCCGLLVGRSIGVQWGCFGIGIGFLSCDFPMDPIGVLCNTCSSSSVWIHWLLAVSSCGSCYFFAMAICSVWLEWLTVPSPRLSRLASWKGFKPALSPDVFRVILKR